MKKILNLILVIFLVFGFCVQADAQKKPAGGEKDEMQVLEENLASLTKKVYASSLFSPEDSNILIEARTQLNDLAGKKLSKAEYAKLFYDAAFVFQAREYKQDSIQYFMIVAKNFPETVYAKRAILELKKCGINIEEDSEEEE